MSSILWSILGKMRTFFAARKRIGINAKVFRYLGYARLKMENVKMCLEKLKENENVAAIIVLLKNYNSYYILAKQV